VKIFGYVLNADTEKLENLRFTFHSLNTADNIDFLQSMRYFFSAKMCVASLKLHYQELNLSRGDDDEIVDEDSEEFRRFRDATIRLYELIGSKFASNYLDGNEYFSDDESVEEERGVARMSKLLKIPSALRCLHLQMNRIGSKGAKLIAEALKVNFNLEVMYLSHNEIGNDGAFFMADMLRINSTLKRLYLEENSISDKGICEIASALEFNSALELLSLNRSRLLILGASQLSKALKRNTSLRKLSLNNCLITDDICSELMEGILYNTSLESIDLSYNEIRNRGAQSIAKVLKRNQENFQRNQ
jgi:Ran GTPase-activating protein (RanGAP) involved in mRNA processing and transport